jgi:hypothetical protein
MLLRTQRRNTAYLNRLNSRFGPLDRELDGSDEQRFRAGDTDPAYLELLLLGVRRLIEGHEQECSWS